MVCKPALKKIATNKSEEFAAIFLRLKQLLTPYAKTLNVAQDTATCYYLETSNPVYKGKPVMFGAVRVGKAYVSYHLFPLYMNAALTSKISPALKRRMQGKTCFNFEKPDEALYGELAALTDESFKCFKGLGAKLATGAVVSDRAK